MKYGTEYNYAAKIQNALNEQMIRDYIKIAVDLLNMGETNLALEIIEKMDNLALHVGNFHNKILV